jgi:SAM-dependent methyltransferase
MLKKYRPAHAKNRMSNEGNTSEARRLYLSGSNRNLQFLLENRFNWMNGFILHHHRGLELGAGTGVTKDFIQSDHFEISDFSDDPWLDHKMVDAQSTHFQNESFDFVILSNMIHHVAKPHVLLNEVERILKPGGVVLIQEIHTSLVTKTLLRIMRHEGWDETVNVFDPEAICNDPRDLWSANCSVPRMLFDDENSFKKNFPNWELIHSNHAEFLTYVNSGGVVAKTAYIPLPHALLNLQLKIDRLLTSRFPNIFALQRQITLQKRRIK